MQKTLSILGAILLISFLSVPTFAQKKTKYSSKASAKTTTSFPTEEKKTASTVKEEEKLKEEKSAEEVFPGLEEVTNSDAPTEEASPAPVAVEEDRVFTVVEAPAEFPGGANAMHKFIDENIKFPKAAKKANVAGKVYTKFLVEKDGTISEIHIVKSLGSGCDEEATRVIKSMPTWKPAHQRGKIVRSYFMLTVNFAPAN